MHYCTTTKLNEHHHQYPLIGTNYANYHIQCLFITFHGENGCRLQCFALECYDSLDTDNELHIYQSQSICESTVYIVDFVIRRPQLRSGSYSNEKRGVKGLSCSCLLLNHLTDSSINTIWIRQRRLWIMILGLDSRHTLLLWCETLDECLFAATASRAVEPRTSTFRYFPKNPQGLCRTQKSFHAICSWNMLVWMAPISLNSNGKVKDLINYLFRN